MRKFFCSIPKLIWAVLCYLVSLTLALVSGFFTFKFYTDGSLSYDFYAMGMMAISLEFIKLMLSAGYPFMKNRDKKNENTVLLVMKISFILSILASLYYLLLGKDITLSPASKTIAMLYQYMPFLGVIPLKFSQFLGTISLSVLIEFFIVFLPTIAPIMFKEKGLDRKTYTITNFDKLKEIFVTVPENFIDNLHRKFVKKSQEDTKEIKNNRPKIKLLKNTSIVKLDLDKEKENQEELNPVKMVNNDLEFVPDKDTDKQTLNPVKESNSSIKEPSNFAQDWHSEGWKNTKSKDVLKAIFDNKQGNVCPSIKDLIFITGLKKNEIHTIKKEFEDLNIIKTDGLQTNIIIDTYQEALKALKGGGVCYER